MLASKFFHAVQTGPDSPCLWAQVKGQWHSYSRGEVADASLRLAQWLFEHQVTRGERVLLLMENRPEWAVAALACARLGAVLVPAYVTHDDAEIRYLLDQTEPKACLNSESLSARVEAALGGQSIAQIEIGVQADRLYPRVVTAVLDESHSYPDKADLYALIATSGTNGLPKIAMLSHGNVAANVESVCQVLDEANLLKPQRFLSFLPLAHAYEHMAGLHLPLAIGGEIFYCDRLDRLATDMAAVKPTLMTAVPRLYELLYQKIQLQMAQESRLKRALFAKTLELGAKPRHTFSLGERFLNQLCEQLVRKKARKRFGGQLQYFVSGGAALNPEIARFFTSLGVGILQGYGQTEASPVISVNRPGQVRMETVGPPLPGVEVKLGPENELLVRGDLVMQGYWKAPEETAKTIQDGWLHTGDLAAIDSDGHIRIVGRVKDLIVNSGGENIAPAPIEQDLVFHPDVEQALLVGDGKPWLAALLVLTDAARERGEDQDSLVRDILRTTNEGKPAYLQVRKALVLETPCTIENGLLTPTHKVKRQRVVDLHRAGIEGLYQ
jgi:long-chain acyl-CoA synthetase